MFEDIDRISLLSLVAQLSVLVLLRIYDGFQVSATSHLILTFIISSKDENPTQEMKSVILNISLQRQFSEISPFWGRGSSRQGFSVALESVLELTR